MMSPKDSFSTYFLKMNMYPFMNVGNFCMLDHVYILKMWRLKMMASSHATTRCHP